MRARCYRYHHHQQQQHHHARAHMSNARALGPQAPEITAELFVEVLGCLANLYLPEFDFFTLVRKHDLLHFLATYAQPGAGEAAKMLGPHALLFATHACPCRVHALLLVTTALLLVLHAQSTKECNAHAYHLVAHAQITKKRAARAYHLVAHTYTHWSCMPNPQARTRHGGATSHPPCRSCLRLLTCYCAVDDDILLEVVMFVGVLANEGTAPMLVESGLVRAPCCAGAEAPGGTELGTSHRNLRSPGALAGYDAVFFAWPLLVESQPGGALGCAGRSFGCRMKSVGCWPGQLALLCTLTCGLNCRCSRVGLVDCVQGSGTLVGACNSTGGATTRCAMCTKLLDAARLFWRLRPQVNTLFLLMGEKKEDDEFVLQIAFAFNKLMVYDSTRNALLGSTQVGRCMQTENTQALSHTRTHTHTQADSQARMQLPAAVNTHARAHTH